LLLPCRLRSEASTPCSTTISRCSSRFDSNWDVRACDLPFCAIAHADKKHGV
jgi:hypothetical protein